MRDSLRPKIFVFDLDNTLVETDIANNLSYMDAINTILNANITWDFNSRFTRDRLYSLFPNLPQELYNSVIETKNERFNAHLKETTLNTNLVKVLSLLHYNGCTTILLTNCHKERAMSICHHFGISNLFSVKYFAEDKVGTKYGTLIRNGYSISSIILFENEAEGAEEAIVNGVDERNIIKVAF